MSNPVAFSKLRFIGSNVLFVGSQHGRKLDWRYQDDAQGRSHLLYLESWEISDPLSELENHARIRNDSKRNHFLAAWTVSENVVKLSQEAHVYLSYRQTQLFLQTSAFPPRDGLQVFL